MGFGGPETGGQKRIFTGLAPDRKKRQFRANLLSSRSFSSIWDLRTSVAQDLLESTDPIRTTRPHRPVPFLFSMLLHRIYRCTFPIAVPPSCIGPRLDFAGPVSRPIALKFRQRRGGGRERERERKGRFRRFLERLESRRMISLFVVRIR